MTRPRYRRVLDRLDGKWLRAKSVPKTVPEPVPNLCQDHATKRWDTVASAPSNLCQFRAKSDRGLDRFGMDWRVGNAMISALSD